MKTTLTFEKISMPAAHLGGENPLPDLQIADLHSSMEVDDSVSPEEAQYFEYGKVNGSLPYRKQDQYDRGSGAGKRSPQSRVFPAVRGEALVFV